MLPNRWRILSIPVTICVQEVRVITSNGLNATVRVYLMQFPDLQTNAIRNSWLYIKLSANTKAVKFTQVMDKTSTPEH